MLKIAPHRLVRFFFLSFIRCEQRRPKHDEFIFIDFLGRCTEYLLLRRNQAYRWKINKSRRRGWYHNYARALTEHSMLIALQIKLVTETWKKKQTLRTQNIYTWNEEGTNATLSSVLHFRYYLLSFSEHFFLLDSILRFWNASLLKPLHIFYVHWCM